MIPFNLEYYAPDNLDEAVELFLSLEEENKKPVYYGGGSEIISFSRHRKINPGAVIDLKSIPETRVFEIKQDRLITGANVTLSVLTDQDIYPLL